MSRRVLDGAVSRLRPRRDEVDGRMRSGCSSSGLFNSVGKVQVQPGKQNYIALGQFPLALPIQEVLEVRFLLDHFSARGRSHESLCISYVQMGQCRRQWLTGAVSGSV